MFTGQEGCQTLIPLPSGGNLHPPKHTHTFLGVQTRSSKENPRINNVSPGLETPWEFQCYLISSWNHKSLLVCTKVQDFPGTNWDFWWIFHTSFTRSSWTALMSFSEGENRPENPSFWEVYSWNLTLCLNCSCSPSRPWQATANQYKHSVVENWFKFCATQSGNVSITQ